MDEYSHNEFGAEAQEISNILNIWDFGFLIGALKKYAQEEPHKRLQLVLKDYFKQLNLNVSSSALRNDAKVIHKIFPEYSMSNIVMLLRQIPNEENRIRIVVQMLLSQNNDDSNNTNQALKRSSPCNLETDVVAAKKSKVVTSTIVSAEQDQDERDEDSLDNNSTSSENSNHSVVASSSSAVKSNSSTTEANQNDSQATITYSVPEIADEVLLVETTSNVNTEKSTTESRPKQAKNNKQNEINRIVQYLTDGLENQENDTERTDLGMRRNGVDESSNATNSIKTNEEVVTTSEPSTSSANKISSNNDVQKADDLPKDEPRKISSIIIKRIKLSEDVSSSSDAADKSNGGKHNLYKQLHTMFPDVPKKEIKSVCSSYNVGKYEKPTQQHLNAIITSLLSFASAYENGGKEDQSDSALDLTFTAHHEPRNHPTPDVPPPVDLKEPTMTEKSVQNAVVKNAPNTSTAETIQQTAKQLESFLSRTAESLTDVLNELKENISDDDIDSVEELLDDDGDFEEETIPDNPLVYPLMEMFPEACPRFLRRMCQGKSNRPGVLDDLISRILEEGDYPRRQKPQSPQHRLALDEQLEILKQVLPDADPSYLQIHCERLIDKPEELKMFIAQAVEHRNYPTLKDYLRKQQLSAQQTQYTTEFSVEKFLEVIPDPIEYFKDGKRKPAKCDLDSHHYAMCYLRNRFNKVQLRSIRDTFRKSSENFLETCKNLEGSPQAALMKSKRAVCEMPSVIQNIPLLQEIAFYEHRKEIEKYKEMKKAQEVTEREEAKKAGLLQTCSCCYDDEVMPKDIYMCENGCVFCKECVRRGAEVAFGDGKLHFACLNSCESHFSLQTLQAVLTPKMFSKMALKKQVEEVKAAGIEDLEMCPFCEFATIPAREDKLFRCLNPECMKESCRLCKEPSHVPLRCEEVEKDDDVKKRTYIENKMTEALLRTCYKCQKKFIKADGCNKMTCSCGALMCYVCGKPVRDYTHFNGPGGDHMNLCPLYSDTNQLHQEAVLKGAEAAKQEIGISDSKQLKIDPSADIQTHYKQVAKANPPPAYVGLAAYNPYQGLDANALVMQQRALQRMEELRNQLNAERIQYNRNRHNQANQRNLQQHQHHQHHGPY